ncbi:lycopene cyclase domain-containing protein [Nocardioides houyundeii]|uniref:lycopene cyclase domain-containing protein n=1 Tax=Nocardioides houyundeii TaxID=2045452 RepID=UPI000C75FCBB|nr:lycopene cyclase domain-containing protein [Nocardioides houyundeii]
MTYAGLAGLFLLSAAALLVVAAVLRRPDRSWWAATGATAAAMMGLTAVFDNVMIAADLFRFEDSQLSGVMIGLAPIEDFAWPLAAVAALPALRLLLQGPARRTEPGTR